MFSKKETEYHYDKHAYETAHIASGYEKRRHYRGLLGRYRKYRERIAIHCAVQQFMSDSVILDCPCGNGRWFNQLTTRARRIVAIDASKVMVKAAGERQLPGTELEIRLGDARHIDVEKDGVDHVFSYALMKHLPHSMKTEVLKEFARVSKGRLAVSFGVFNWFGFLLWKLRGSPGPGLLRWTEIEALASEASLIIGTVYKSGIPLIGMGTLVVFEREPF